MLQQRVCEFLSVCAEKFQCKKFAKCFFFSEFFLCSFAFIKKEILFEAIHEFEKSKIRFCCCALSRSKLRSFIVISVFYCLKFRVDRRGRWDSEFFSFMGRAWTWLNRSDVMSVETEFDGIRRSVCFSKH